MFRKKSLFILIVFIVAISAVSAADLNTTEDVVSQEIAVDDSNQDVMSSTTEDDVLSMEPIPELQNLIENSKNGDVIELTKDYNLYKGFICVNKSVTIDGNNHKLNANYQDAFLIVLNESVTLKNIQFVNWGNQKSDESCCYIGIYASGVTISNCKFINCTTDIKSIVHGEEPYLTIDSCQFVNCNSLNDGIIYCDGSNLKVTNTEFKNNNANYGTRQHKDSEYDSNPYDSVSYAGALYIKGDNAFVENCKFDNNTGYMAGAVIVKGNKGYIKDCSFTNNRVRHMKVYDATYTYVGGKVVEIKYVRTAGAIIWEGNDGTLENPVSIANNQGYTDINVFGENYKLVNPTILKASDVTKYYGGSEKYVVTLTKNNAAIANANVKITINGNTNTYKTDSNGKASCKLDLAPKTYEVTSEYGNAKVTSKVTVKSTITAQDATGTYSASKVTATFLDTAGNPLASKQVTFKIGDTSYSATTNSNGVATANIPLGVGTYTVTAINPANNEQKQFKLTISKATTTTSLTTSQNGKSVTLTATVTPNKATGKVTFSVDGKTREATISNGKASVTITDLAENSYDATATYSGDGNFKTSTATTSFKVDKVYSITNTGDAVGTYSDSKVTATFLDGAGKALANTKVTFKAGGKSYSATTNSNGAATASIDLDAGTYDVTAVNPTTKEEKQFKLTINKATPEFKLKAVKTPGVEGMVNIIATFTQSEASGNVKVSREGDFIYSADIKDGKAEITTFYGPDATYTVTVTYNGNNNFKETSRNFTFNVPSNSELFLTANSVSLTYGQHKSLVICVKDINGNPVEDHIVSIYFYGFYCDYPMALSSDENGQIEVDCHDFIPDTYEIEIISDNCKDVKTQAVVKKLTPKLTANKKTFKLSAKTKKYTVTLKNNKNKAMTNKKVKLTVNGKTYSAKTNSKGQATFKITNLKKKGTYSAAVKYAGSTYYKKVTKTAKITIK